MLCLVAGLAVVASVALVVLSGAVSAQTEPAPAAAPPSGGPDVVMMRCVGGQMGFHVAAFQGSPGAPARTSNSCPETLAAMLAAGFEIKHVGYHVEVEEVLYTMIR
jgi:hypothetical protein